MKKKKKKQKPIVVKKTDPVTKARLALARGNLEARDLADHLRTLLDDDPGNLNGPTMLALYFKYPEHSWVLKKFTARGLLGPISRELQKTTHPSFREVFREELLRRQEILDGSTKPQPEPTGDTQKGTRKRIGSSVQRTTSAPLGPGSR